MGYISGNVVTINNSTTLNEYRSVPGRSTVEVASTGTATEVLSNGTTWRKVGALDGTVSVTPNHEVVKLQSSALQNPYAVLDTGYDYQVSFVLQEVDLHNYALSLGFSGASVIQDALGGNAAVDTARLNLKAGQGASYRAMRIISLAAANNATATYQAIVFFKVRFQATGSFDFDRTSAVNIPVTAHCLAHSNDEVGSILSGTEIATRAYS